MWNDVFGAGGGGRPAYFTPEVPTWCRQHGDSPSWYPRHLHERRSQRGSLGLLVVCREGPPGWELVGGTSESTPLFSGIVALADQEAHQRLGNINPFLYSLGSRRTHRLPTGIQDITDGNNSFNGVSEFIATPGYDLASGWGTIDAAEFVPALASFGDRGPIQSEPSPSGRTPGKSQRGSRRGPGKERLAERSSQHLRGPRTTSTR